jgi:hypothetical protein
MRKKYDWEIKQDKERKLRKKGRQALTIEQIQAVHSTYEALNAAMLSIRDLNDLSLSEIKALDEACCDLHREFISQI